MILARWLLLFPAVAGCTSKPTTHPVTGTVRFEDGSAANVGLIEFVPVAGGPSARGPIAPGGQYRLSTFATDDGALAGEYVVLISQPQLLVGSLRAAPEGHNDEHHGGENLGRGVVPARYSRRDASPLRATVAPGENRIGFELEAARTPAS